MPKPAQPKCPSEFCNILHTQAPKAFWATNDFPIYAAVTSVAMQELNGQGYYVHEARIGKIDEAKQ
jgi:hypothetical protein